MRCYLYSCKSNAMKKRYLTCFILVAFFLSGVGGVLTVLYATSKYGVGISPDSVAYISTGRSLLSGNGFHLFNGEHFVHWPPLFPVLLAMAGFGGCALEVCARLINSSLFGMLIIACGFLVWQLIGSFPLVFSALLALLFSAPLLSVAVMAWSETCFIVFSLVFFIVFFQYLKQQNMSCLVLSALVACMGCLLRYTGVLLVAIGALSLILIISEKSLRERIRHAAVFICVSLAPLGIWICHNFYVTHTLTGHRAPAYWGVVKNSAVALDSLSLWLLPSSLPHIMLLGAAGAFLIFLVFTAFVNPVAFKCTTRLRIFIFYFLGYVCFLIVTSSLMANEPITNRLLSPLYPFFIIISTVFLKKCYHLLVDLSGFKKIMSHTMIVFLYCFWLCYSVISGWRFVENCKVEGAGKDFFGQGYYGTSVWKDSPLIQWLNSNLSTGLLYTNEPYACYILANIVAKNLPVDSDSADRFVAALPPNRSCFLLWFTNRMDNKDRFLFSYDSKCTLEKLNELIELEVIAAFTDGAIYKICKKKR